MQATTALWLIPEQRAAEELRRVIEEYAFRFGTPRFAPHLTLLSGIEAFSAEDFTAWPASPLTAICHGVSQAEDFYRCVVVEIDPSSALQSLRESAERRFSHRGDDSWWPHISLMYGDLQEEVRRRIAGDIGPSFEGRQLEMTAAEAVLIDGEPSKWAIRARKTLE